MMYKGSITLLAFAFGGLALIGTRVSRVARRYFLKRIEHLRQTIEESPKALALRTDLPPQVLALSCRLGACDRKEVRSVRLTQIGYMWLKPGSKALDFSAAEIMSVVEVGFLWRAWFRMAGVSMQIIDYLAGSEAGLEGRLLSSVPVLRMTGTDAMFRGEAMRYLAELMWNPDAILFNRQLTWHVLDAHTLAVATGEGGRRCEVRLILDEMAIRSGWRQTIGRARTAVRWKTAHGSAVPATFEPSAIDESQFRRRRVGSSTVSNSYTGVAASDPGQKWPDPLGPTPLDFSLTFLQH